MNMFRRKATHGMIKLHCPGEIYVRPEEIAVMRWYDEDGGITRICLSSGRCWVVYETPEQILKLIKEAK